MAIRLISSLRRKKRMTKSTTLGGLLRGHARQQVRNCRWNKKCPSPKGLRANFVRLRAELVTALSTGRPMGLLRFNVRQWFDAELRRHLKSTEK